MFDAAGEEINLQRAHVMVNYDLPWNPNSLEQRFGDAVFDVLGRLDFGDGRGLRDLLIDAVRGAASRAPAEPATAPPGMRLSRLTVAMALVRHLRRLPRLTDAPAFNR